MIHERAKSHDISTNKHMKLKKRYVNLDCKIRELNQKNVSYFQNPILHKCIYFLF